MHLDTQTLQYSKMNIKSQNKLKGKQPNSTPST